MTTYSAIGNGEIDANSPITQSLMTRMRDNPLAIFEALGWLPTSKVYISPQQTITAAGVLSLPHGLTVPSSNVLNIDIEIYLVNINAEFGYSPGDVTIPIMDCNNSIGAMSWPAIKLTTTNINLRYGNAPFVVTNYTTGAGAVVTAANWKMVIKARA